MSTDAYKELFRANTALGKRCDRAVHAITPKNADWRKQMKQRDATLAYMRTLLRRYAEGNFDNTPTDRQIEILEGDVQVFMDVEAVVKKNIDAAAKELRKEADKIEREAAAKVQKLRETAVLYDEYHAVIGA